MRVKNFGFWLKYQSRSGVHNMYREYRALSVEVAAKKLFMDMGGRHRAKKDNIHVIDVRNIGSRSKEIQNQTVLDTGTSIQEPVQSTEDTVHQSQTCLLLQDTLYTLRLDVMTSSCFVMLIGA